jgi:hypothetical protein
LQELLINAPPLAGCWGLERYGLADAAVVRALEGLDGAERCMRYRFVEERGTWAAEEKRLEQERLARGKQQQRVRCIPSLAT